VGEAYAERRVLLRMVQAEVVKYEAAVIVDDANSIIRRMRRRDFTSNSLPARPAGTRLSADSLIAEKQLPFMGCSRAGAGYSPLKSV